MDAWRSMSLAVFVSSETRATPTRNCQDPTVASIQPLEILLSRTSDRVGPMTSRSTSKLPSSGGSVANRSAALSLTSPGVEQMATLR
jgi:hypothetical protein